MTRRKNNIFAVIVWLLGLLGCIGYINPLGFLSLLIPLIFWLLGTKFTKKHCEAYFNVLITGVIIHVLGEAITKLLSWIGIAVIQLKYLGLLYFLILSIIGLLTALNNRRYSPSLVIKIF